MKTYAIHSIFFTVQGEGQWVGTPALFIRFAGCNVWSGNPEDREKATKRGLCAAWCDTEFRIKTGMGRMTLNEIVHVATGPAREWAEEAPPIVVCTGGEPGLQLDAELVDGLRACGFRVHVETNGSQELPDVDWITLSPKPPMPVVLKRVDEVKCIYPDVSPSDWRDLAPELQVFIQPRDDNNGSELQQRRWAECLAYVSKNPWARLCIQTHKLLGVE